MAEEKKKKWKVRVNPFPLNKAQNIFIPVGEIFEATEEQVKPYKHLVVEVTEEEEKEEETESQPRKRGRPPKRVEAFSEPPEDRSF